MTKTLCCLKVFESIYNHSSLRTKFSKLIKKTQTNTKKTTKTFQKSNSITTHRFSLHTHTEKKTLETLDNSLIIQ